MSYFSWFFSLRKFTFAELLLIPEVTVYLLISYFKVNFLNAKYYIPNKLIRIDSESHENYDDSIIRNISFFVNRLSLFTPWKSTCLIKALAAHKMLSKRKIPHSLHFGVFIDAKDNIQAHAWLAVDNYVLVGGEIISNYHEIASFEL